MRIDNPQLSGSILITGSTVLTGSLTVTDIIYGTATNANSALYAVTASYALNAGGGEGVGFPYSGSAEITGSLKVSQGNISGSFVGDGSGLKNISVDQITSSEYIFENQTEILVNHNLNSKNIQITAFNENDYVFIPATIRAVDLNNVSITFDNASSGRIVINKGGHLITATNVVGTTTTSVYSHPFVEQVNLTVNHNFNTSDLVVSVYGTDNIQIIPAQVELVGTDKITVTFDESTSGKVVIVKGGSTVQNNVDGNITAYSQQFNSSVNLNIEHSLNTTDVIVSIYDENNLQLIPGKVELVDVNNITVSFDKETTGKIVLVKGGTLNNTVQDTPTYIIPVQGDSVYSIEHNLTSDFPIVQVYDLNKQQIVPASITSTTSNTVTVTFDNIFEGTVVVKK